MKQENPQQDGFTAEELGEASSYEGTTEMGQRMRRGNEEEQNKDDRDVAGATDFADTPEGRSDKDTVDHANTPK